MSAAGTSRSAGPDVVPPPGLAHRPPVGQLVPDRVAGVGRPLDLRHEVDVGEVTPQLASGHGVDGGVVVHLDLVLAAACRSSVPSARTRRTHRARRRGRSGRSVLRLGVVAGDHVGAGADPDEPVGPLDRPGAHRLLAGDHLHRQAHELLGVDQLDGPDRRVEEPNEVGVGEPVGPLGGGPVPEAAVDRPLGRDQERRHFAGIDRGLELGPHHRR